MLSQTLEFRGIPLQLLLSYFLELGAQQVSSQYPIHLKGANWAAEIQREDVVRIASNFSVNAVHIEFTADDPETLDILIANYRKKTFRAGG